jgi:hypothetical protein
VCVCVCLCVCMYVCMYICISSSNIKDITQQFEKLSVGVTDERNLSCTPLSWPQMA